MDQPVRRMVQVNTYQGASAGNVTTVFPEQDVPQVELLVTVGFLR